MHQQIYKKNFEKMSRHKGNQKTEIGQKKSNCNQFSTIFRKFILMQISHFELTKKRCYIS